MAAIAVVGMACRYPDAGSPAELWENVLAQRRAFRRLPPERLRAEDYYSPDRSAPDRTYSMEAAPIEGYEFDRVRFRVSGSTFRAADLAHWLALDVAAQALADAGFDEGRGLPRASTGVVVGNTLTGEFSRANVLRLRWPYVRRVVEAALLEQGWPAEQRRPFLEELERRYKSPFPPMGEESLPGSLSNTIAGRICNHFDLHGGGYTVDGACASSLLAVINACTALETGDLDLAVAGGVDLSLDPFELVGFAKTGALAPDVMRVYDRRSSGFWPGEGCGMVVLMRHEEAVAQGRRVYALVRGWGVSSDGSGGITRPEVAGQLLALQRAYRRAGFGIDSVSYFEGHGTGTAVGDATELAALARARREAASGAPPAAVGSVKANIGHTKAAAGVAGFIKATLALHTQVVPPTTGCEQPHPALAGTLRVVRRGEAWHRERPLRAGVSAMGFGGINTHVVLEGPAAERRPSLGPREEALLSSPQDAELFLLGARDADGLSRQVARLSEIAPRLARSELTDLAAALAGRIDGGETRAAVVASSPAELERGLAALKGWLAGGATARLDFRAGAFLGYGSTPPRIGFLFPGQGSPVYLDGGAWANRFEVARAVYARAGLVAGADPLATAVAQPALVAASLAGLRVLDRLGVTAAVAVGHSLGELAALHWAGACDGDALLRIAAARGRAMAALPGAGGAMASVAAGSGEVGALVNGAPVVLAGLNSPRQTVISGEAAAVGAVAARARDQGLRVVSLPVSCAFHSPLVAPAIPRLSEHLAGENFRPLRRSVISTVTGQPLPPGQDLRELLCRQVISPVRFLEALAAADHDVALWIEVGAGSVLCGLAGDSTDSSLVSIDAGGPSLRGLGHALGAAFALGAPLDRAALFGDRFTRPFEIDRRQRFFVNPCELAPLPEVGEVGVPALAGLDDQHRLKPGLQPNGSTSPAGLGDQHRLKPGLQPNGSTSPVDVRGLVRRLVAEHAELPVAAVKDDDRLLSNLHLNSIAVGQLVAGAARRLGLVPLVAPTEYADATVAEVARSLEELARTGNGAAAAPETQAPPGVDSWVRCFTVELVERPLVSRPRAGEKGPWRVFAPDGHPLRESLPQVLGTLGGGGVVVCLPPQPDEQHASLLLEAAQAVLKGRRPARFVVVQQGGGGAAVARTLHLEAPEVTTCVVDVPLDHPRAAEWVSAEALAAHGYAEAHYDFSGRRRVPVLRLLPPGPEQAETPLGPADVVLVTGGGKGIAAECAAMLGRSTAARLILMGRSRPAEDAELSANLDRLAATGVSFRYVAADVTDGAAVRGALHGLGAAWGPVTGLVHGAGTNVPCLLASLDAEAFRRTLGPKVRGLTNVLAAVDPTRLRLLLTFGSLIARTGLRGEADYALANEWLTRLTERFQARHPLCRCLAVEWSVWSGVGMGERLGRIEALVRQGITPIPPDTGLAVLRDLLGRPLPATAVVVAGRFGEPPTLRMESPELPLLRFLERPRVYYPGVELVVEADLSADTDPYLADHAYRGEPLLPAVMGLEAMAQVARAVTGTAERPAFEGVTFQRPVTVLEAGRVTVRLAALVREPGRVEVVLRSAETAFQVDHFRAICRFADGAAPALRQFPAGVGVPVPLDPAADLYGDLLFQRGRFQRLRGYRVLRSTECVAEIGPGEEGDWFGRYLPSALLLPDPGARDAALHAVQACIPHATVLPVGVERVVFAASVPHGPALLWARERLREGDTLVYDLDVVNADGTVRECWEGLRLRRVAAAHPRNGWPAPLLGPYLERRIAELVPGAAVAVVVERSAGGERRRDSTRALQRALGAARAIHHRADGKPEVAGGDAVSAAHAGDLTLAVAGRAPLACDVERVEARPAAVWGDLLGTEGVALASRLVRDARDDETVAATRVWVARECLKKAGAMPGTPLVLAACAADGWVLLSAGCCRIATAVAVVRGVPSPLVLAVLTGGGG